jgi:hypothetical protein
MRTRILFLAVALTSLLALNSTAGVITFGPVRDFAGWEYVATSVVVPTEFTSTFHIPGDGNVSIHLHDSITVRVTQAMPIYVPSYVRIKIVGDPQIEDPLSFFDIYAQDLDPDNPVTKLSGFTAQSPELIPLSAEKFIGVSGTEYYAPVQAIYLGDLPSVVPDFDLSAFSHGDPGSIVYLAGPGNVPLADATVPEPAAIVFLGLGATSLLVCAWRRRMQGQ